VYTIVQLLKNRKHPVQLVKVVQIDFYEDAFDTKKQLCAKAKKNIELKFGTFLYVMEAVFYQNLKFVRTNFDEPEKAQF
jgi:hypothetical protein